MENNLASNIRAFRKERGLTQEKLAEAFGVTVGAVHKWEAGMSVPDLSLILEMADFFDTSLDVLIGFEARDNRISVLAGRLRKMAYTMDPDGLSEAEKALKKYPHNFSIVFESLPSRNSKISFMPITYCSQSSHNLFKHAVILNYNIYVNYRLCS